MRSILIPKKTLERREEEGDGEEEEGLSKEDGGDGDQR